ncbi:MAG: lysophospholipid acyltransferase family protein [Phycisphaerales bacterium JB043]
MAFNPPIWTHPFFGGGVRALTGLIRAAGVDDSISTLRDIGGAYATSSRSRHRLQRAIENLSWAFPDMAMDEVHDRAIESYRHLFSLIAEIACAPSFFASDEWEQRIVFDNSIWPSVDLLREHNPCVLITAHCGNWEMLGMALGNWGFPVHALYRPLDLKPLDKWVHESRSRHGLYLLDKFGAAEKFHRIIERGESIGFTADQNAGAKGVYVPFFDRLASTYKSIGLLAIQYQLPLACGFAQRLFDRKTQHYQYRLAVTDLIKPEDWSNQPDPLFYVSARYRRAIEMMVRADPSQYLWMHRAWKTRPKFERMGRPVPSSLADKIRALPWMGEAQYERIIERAARDASEHSS